jgi:hypothetical protein
VSIFTSIFHCLVIFKDNVQEEKNERRKIGRKERKANRTRKLQKKKK